MGQIRSSFLTRLPHCSNYKVRERAEEFKANLPKPAIPISTQPAKRINANINVCTLYSKEMTPVKQCRISCVSLLRKLNPIVLNCGSAGLKRTEISSWTVAKVQLLWWKIVLDQHLRPAPLKTTISLSNNGYVFREMSEWKNQCVDLLWGVAAEKDLLS